MSLINIDGKITKVNEALLNQLLLEVTLTPQVKKVFNKFGIQYDDTKQHEIGFNPEAKKMTVTLGTRTDAMKPGKVLRLIDGKIDGVELNSNEIDMLIRVLSSEMKETASYIVSDDVSKKYCFIDSCMQNSNTVKFYDNFDSIKIVLILEHDKIVARALLWTKVQGLNRPYLDRAYPSTTPKYHLEFQRIAIENDWYYRGDQSISAYTQIGYKNQVTSKLIKFVFNRKELTVYKGRLPFVDTFRFGRWVSADGTPLMKEEVTDDSYFEMSNDDSFYDEFDEDTFALTDHKNGTSIVPLKTYDKLLSLIQYQANSLTEELSKSELKNLNMQIFSLLKTDKSLLHRKTDHENATLLHFAAQQCNIEMMAYLIKAGLDVNARTLEGETPLTLATYNEEYRFDPKKVERAVKLLVANKAFVNASNINGETALHNAIEYLYHSVIKILINNGADVNQKSKGEKSPLYWAFSEDDMKSVKMLLTATALIDQKTYAKYKKQLKQIKVGQIVLNFEKEEDKQDFYK